MVILPSGLTFVATPRTGSRAISEALLSKHKDAISDYPQNHHMWPESVPKDYPIYTVIRNPADQMVSWWHHVDVRHSSKRTILEFAQEYNNIMFFPRNEKYILNIYAEIADVFIPYDPKLKNVSNVLNLSKIKIVGKPSARITDREHKDLTEYMSEAYKADVLLWYKVLRGYK